jgi:hypothetical protein
MKDQAKIITDTTIELDYYENLYRIEWRVAPRWRNITGYGDVYSVCTQCLIFQNGFLIGNDYSFKHSEDQHNLTHAMKVSAGKAFKKCNTDSDMRDKFWKLFFEKNK